MAAYPPRSYILSTSAKLRCRHRAAEPGGLLAYDGSHIAETSPCDDLLNGTKGIVTRLG